jgi:thiamine-phosphate pyrophosphorylase
MNQQIYCITAEEYSNGRSNIEIVKQMIEAGIKIIQYREKNKKKLVKYEECKVIREITKKAGALLIVNDDVDLALSVEADGIHIGQDDLPIEAVRRLVGEEMIVGLSTHSLEQANDAVKRGADYIGVGPIFSTNTKKDVCSPVGFEYLDEVVRYIDLPFVVIGGIKEQNLYEVIEHGAKCVAIITDIISAEDIGSKIKRLKSIINQQTI